MIWVVGLIVLTRLRQRFAMNKFLTFLGTESNGFSDFSKALEQAGGNVGATRGASSFKTSTSRTCRGSETTATRFQKAQHDYIQRKLS